jgi:DNA-binding XRE family transcriptional regulator
MDIIERPKRQTAYGSLPPEEKKKANARAYLNSNIRRGVVQKQPCSVCGTTYELEAHHDDYEKPLQVTWFCRKHHKEFHMKFKPVKDVPPSLSFSVIKARFIKNMLILRHEHGLSQKDMSIFCEVKLSTYQAYEEARSFPPIDILLRISQHFKISLEILLTTEIKSASMN